MLKRKQIQQFYAKFNKNECNQSKLARSFKCSNGKLTKILNQEVSCNAIEKNILDWLYDRKEILL